MHKNCQKTIFTTSNTIEFLQTRTGNANSKKDVKTKLSLRGLKEIRTNKTINIPTPQWFKTTINQMQVLRPSI